MTFDVRSTAEPIQ